MHKLHIEYLESIGIKVLCESPLKISSTIGSIATGDLAEQLIANSNLPNIYKTWRHETLQLTCEEAFTSDDLEGYYGLAIKSLDPYELHKHAEIKIGDFWVVNGAWWGRREENGFRVLATGTLCECDDSEWTSTEATKDEDLGEYLEGCVDGYDEFGNDMVAF